MVLKDRKMKLREIANTLNISNISLQLYMKIVECTSGFQSGCRVCLCMFIDYLEKGKTTNNEYYMILLDQLSTEIRKKNCSTYKKSVVSSRQCPMLQVDENNG